MIESGIDLSSQVYSYRLDFYQVPLHTLNLIEQQSDLSIKANQGTENDWPL